MFSAVALAAIGSHNNATAIADFAVFSIPIIIGIIAIAEPATALPGIKFSKSVAAIAIIILNGDLLNNLRKITFALAFAAFALVKVRCLAITIT
ncbi:MAG: hypothetical protein ORN51_06520 [Akkermansiaceae bacterium]|nr:hypothetical protein [Akkermansiaceae bacterium]